MTATSSTLRQDPELGPLFDDLDAALDDRGLDHLRPPSAPPPPPGPRWWWWAGGVGVAVVLLSWMTWRSAEERPVDLVPAPVVVASSPSASARHESAPPAVAAEAPAPIIVATVSGPRASDPGPQPTAEPVLLVAELVPDPPPPPPPLPPASAVLPVVDHLAAEESLYRPAAEALAAGDWSAAVERSGAYLAVYPRGRWAEEARLLELSARVGAGDWAGVEALAARLDELPELATRHDDLLLARAEALVVLGRCPEALALVTSLPKKASAAVRRSCE